MERHLFNLDALFAPRIEIRPKFGLQEHIDLVRSLGKRVETAGGVLFLMGSGEENLLFNKPAVRDLCTELGLSDLKFTVEILGGLPAGYGLIGKVGSSDDERKKDIMYISRRVDLAILHKLELVSDGLAEETALVLTLNHIFFHEMKHLDQIERGDGVGANEEEEMEREAENFAVGRMRCVVGGRPDLAAIWPVSVVYCD